MKQEILLYGNKDQAYRRTNNARVHAHTPTHTCMHVRTRAHTHTQSFIPDIKFFITGDNDMKGDQFVYTHKNKL